jgi:phospholipase D1/2
VFAVALVRLLPIAPFSIVNAVAGATHIRTADFLIGTMLGMLPGIVLTTTFIDQLLKAIDRPSAAAFALLAAAALAMVLSARVLRRRLATA